MAAHDFSNAFVGVGRRLVSSSSSPIVSNRRIHSREDLVQVRRIAMTTTTTTTRPSSESSYRVVVVLAVVAVAVAASS